MTDAYLATYRKIMCKYINLKMLTCITPKLMRKMVIKSFHEGKIMVYLPLTLNIYCKVTINCTNPPCVKMKCIIFFCYKHHYNLFSESLPIYKEHYL